MNSKIRDLLSDLESTKFRTNLELESIREKLQAEYNKVFNDSKELAKAIDNAEQSSMYQFDKYGEGIESWYRWSGLSDYQDCREYFEAWLSDGYCMHVDWDNECLLVSHGDDNITIQDDLRCRRDNGVYQGHKMIIPETEYLVEQDGHSLTDYTVDVEKRNALIEAHMERTGYFPGVFRVTQYGDVFPVNTKSKDGAA